MNRYHRKILLDVFHADEHSLKFIRKNKSSVYIQSFNVIYKAPPITAVSQ